MNVPLTYEEACMTVAALEDKLDYLEEHLGKDGGRFQAAYRPIIDRLTAEIAKAAVQAYRRDNPQYPGIET
jgi:hypothetical protein